MNFIYKKIAKQSIEYQIHQISLFSPSAHSEDFHPTERNININFACNYSYCIPIFFNSL